MSYTHAHPCAFVALPRSTPRLQDHEYRPPYSLMKISLHEQSVSTLNLGVTVEQVDNALSFPSSTATTTTFEPIMPDLFPFVTIVLFCIAAAWVWANQVVPVARTNLAISKRSGPVADYLDELRQAGNNNSTEVALESSSIDNHRESELTMSNSRNNRAFERWLFSDWLQAKSEQRRAGRQKDPALPILKNAKWNSGDNPVLAATALILLGVVFTSITERVATTLHL